MEIDHIQNIQSISKLDSQGDGFNNEQDVQEYLNKN